MAISHFLPSLLYLISICFIGLCFYLGGLKSALLSLGISVFCLGNLSRIDAVQRADEFRFRQLGVVQIEAILLEDAEGNKGKWSAIARIRNIEFQGKNVLWRGHGEPPASGTHIRAFGTFEPFIQVRNPGVPERSEHLRHQGVVAIFQASAMRSESWIHPLSKWAADLRKQFREGMVLGLDPEGEGAKVIQAIVIGERARDAWGLIRKYRESGTLHIFSVSGMHVVIIGSMVWFIFRIVRVPRRMAIPGIILAMFAYSWLSGNGPASVRAASMAALFLSAFLVRRRPDLLNTLGCVLILSLLWDPRMIRMTGVQLSYGVVAAIGIGTSWAKSFYTEQNSLYLPQSKKGVWRVRWEGFRKSLTHSLFVSGAASFGSLPLSFFHLGVIAPISALTTVVLIPFVYAILTLGLSAALLSPFSVKAASYLNQLNEQVAHHCTATAGFFANLPGASGSLSRAYRDSLLIYDLAYGASCACFTSKAGNSVLLDTGGKSALKSEIGSSLMRLGLKPDSVIFSHQDAGHSAPVSLLQEMFPLRQILGENPSKQDSNDDKNVPFHTPKRGQRIELGEAAWAELLWVKDRSSHVSLADDRCMVLRLHWKDWKILFTNDAGRLTEEALLREGIDVSADFIVTSLHERDVSLTPAFIGAVNPCAIIFPRKTGKELDSHQNARKQAYAERGITIIDQNQTGGLTLKILTSGDLKIEGFLDRSKLVFSQKKKN